MTVFDVGAHAGYYTLMFSRLVGTKGRVLSFEANPDNANNLRKHLLINRLQNVEVIEAAVCDQSGEAYFATNTNRSRYGYMGTLAETGTRVRTIHLDSFPAPDLIKMDIEGAETLALTGASRILSEHKATIFLALHEGAFETAPSVLEKHGYTIDRIADRELWAVPPK